MLLSLWKNGLTSLFKEVRVFKATRGVKFRGSRALCLSDLRGLGIRPLASKIRGLGNSLQVPLRARGPGAALRGLGEGCPFSMEREKKVAT